MCKRNKKGMVNSQGVLVHPFLHPFHPFQEILEKCLQKGFLGLQVVPEGLEDLGDPDNNSWR